VPEAPALQPERSGNERPTVLVAVAEPFVKEGIRFVLEQDGFDVSAGVSSADEAVALAFATEPQVCLLDQELDGDVVEATRRISALPRTATVILSGAVDRRALLAALQAGAAGYLLKSVEAPALSEALRSAIRGEAVISRRLISAMLDALALEGTRHADLADGRIVALTEREWEVAGMLARREPTTEMAAALGISSVTVRRHLSGLMQKLGVTSREDAWHLLRPATGPR
jgi:DNA-binding NarL/FixJ family response regulator